MTAPLGRTGIYMRLSRDDEKAGESMSIENQRAMLLQYVAENGGTVAGEYADDGWSGTDFERPGVARLLEDAKEGKIDTIIVKDLSRFGRNYIRVGQYIDYLFPAYGIRFIALADNVDTADRSGAGMDMMPIMNVFNEWHAANTSKKIRAVLESNWRAGKYTNWAYPYGYKAGSDEKRTAVIDGEAAGIVRRIYDMRLQGNSARTIARRLTDEGVPNPATYFTRLDGKKSDRRCSPHWTPKTVMGILCNPTYIGTMTQHKTTRFSYKNHKVVTVPEGERIVKEDAHAAIISREVWEQVQAMRAAPRGRADQAQEVHPLSGLLVCADCGKKMKRRASKGKNACYACRTYVDLGKQYCTSHSIGERQLEELLLRDIRTMLGTVSIDAEAAGKAYLKKLEARGAQDRRAAEKELRACRARLVQLDSLIASAFEERVLGKLPESVCKSLCERYQAEKVRVAEQIAALEARLARPDDAQTAKQYAARLVHYAACEELTRELCLQLVEKIVVGERASSRTIEIYYRFCAPMAPSP